MAEDLKEKCGSYLTNIFPDKTTGLRQTKKLPIRRIVCTPIRRFLGLADEGFQRSLSKVEDYALRAKPKPKYPPIFMFGPPRSGTTLIYQVLTYGLSLSYFCNLADRFSLCPGVVTLLAHSVTKITPPCAFHSYYGETKGWSSPNQGRKIWSRWFPSQSYIKKGTLSKTELDKLRGTVALVERAFKMPFINKAQGHCVRMQALDDAFPDALFIKVNRDYLGIVQSILYGRQEVFGDKRHWFSVQPRKYDVIKDHDPIRQVCEHVYYLEEDMRYQIDVIGKSRVFEIDYKEFCADTRGAVNAFRQFYEEKTGVSLSLLKEIPPSFKPSSKMKVSETESYELRKCLGDLFGDDLVHSAVNTRSLS